MSGVITGSPEEVIADISSVHNNTNCDGTCSNCGGCCGVLLPVSKAEIKEIKRYIKRKHIKEQKHEEIKRDVLRSGFLDMTCPFRDNTAQKCTIYPVRPAICRVFMCNRKPDVKRDRELYQGKRDLINMRGEFFKVDKNDDLITRLIDARAREGMRQ